MPFFDLDPIDPDLDLAGERKGDAFPPGPAARPNGRWMRRTRRRAGPGSTGWKP